jgi:hypothetical protein
VAVLSQVDANFDSSRMEIDYVRVFQKGDDSGTLKTPTLQQKGSIYPNPVRETLFLHELETFNSYSLFDLSGRKVQSGTISSSHQIDVRTLKPGIYHLNLNHHRDGSMESSKATFKIIKE